MNKTAIEWCDQTWNPVTGCLHGCEYCYARKIARRFEGWEYTCGLCRVNISENKSFIAESEGIGFRAFKHNETTMLEIDIDGCLDKGFVLKNYKNAPYPIGFNPTFHGYRLNEPQYKKKPQNIFVCSMADLFGAWVPSDWIKAVFEACEKVPQHRYLFLTKNPKRYMELYNVLPKGNNFFYGTTATTEDTDYWYSENHNWFLSIEPIMGKFSGNGFSGDKPLFEGPRIKSKWVIIGAETGKRKGKVIPKKEWIEAIVNECRRNKTPVFLKNNLAKVWGEPLIQEYPWEGVKNGCQNP